MRDLNYDLKQLCRHNRDGSYATQADREHILDLIADQLHEMGFRHMNAHSLKPKHVEKLVERWLAEKLSPGTIKNRMSALRWWAEKIGKENIIARTNAAYGIPDRVYVTNISKAKELDMDKLKQIPDLFIHMSLCLQALFGLRREESIKIVPKWADRGDRLVLKASWTKGGREREIPIRTQEQRQLVDEAKALAKGKSLVAPRYTTYRDYLKYFRYQVRAGRHSRLPRPSPFLCADALPGIDRLGVPGARRHQVKATHAEAEGNRSPGAGGHQPRDGPRPRADYGGVLGSIGIDRNTRQQGSRMNTLDLQAAAAFLHIHPVTLQEKARAGEIPGAKIGKCWVFVDVDLIEHIRSQYPRRVLQSERKELEPCHSTNATTHRIGGSRSATAEEQYSAALGLKTNLKPRSTTTS